MLGIRREIDEECVILYINMTGETLQTREKTGKNFEILSGNRADAAPLPADQGNICGNPGGGRGVHHFKSTLIVKIERSAGIPQKRGKR